jgi:hypothetical protein
MGQSYPGITMLRAALTAHAVAVAYKDSRTRKAVESLYTRTRANLNDRIMPQSQFALHGALRLESFKSTSEICRTAASYVSLAAFMCSNLSVLQLVIRDCRLGMVRSTKPLPSGSRASYACSHLPCRCARSAEVKVMAMAKSIAGSMGRIFTSYRR